MYVYDWTRSFHLCVCDSCFFLNLNSFTNHMRSLITIKQTKLISRYEVNEYNHTNFVKINVKKIENKNKTIDDRLRSSSFVSFCSLLPIEKKNKWSRNSEIQTRACSQLQNEFDFFELFGGFISKIVLTQILIFVFLGVFVKWRRFLTGWFFLISLNVEDFLTEKRWLFQILWSKV